MTTQYPHLVFYDGHCGFCDSVVQFLIQVDKKKLFAFAPLQGETAARLLANLPPEMKNEDSLVLIEDYQSNNPKTFILAKGATRIAWLLGGPWVLLGWLSFMPGFLIDWGYRLVARNRHRLFSSTQCVVPTAQERGRFLP